MEATRQNPVTTALAAWLLVLVLMPTAAVADVEPVDGPVEGPHLLVEVTSRASDPLEGTLRIAERANETVVYEEVHTFPARETTTLRIPLPPADYEVELEREEREDMVAFQYVATIVGSHGADLRGCPGPYRAPFHIQEQSVAPLEDGCLAEPEAFQRLVAAAERARDPQGASLDVHVPLPGGEDEGRYARWEKLRTPVWTEVEEGLPFSWTPNQSFPDAWGRMVPGAEVRLQLPPTRSAARGPLSPGFTVADSDRPEGLRFQDGSLEPTARSALASTYASVTPLGTAAERTWEITYMDKGDLLPCLFRNQLQGSTVETGDRVQMGCPGLEGRTLHAGTPVTHQGLEALPLYHVGHNEDGSRTLTRMLVADGIPYPVVLQRFKAGQGTLAEHQAHGLTHLDLGGTTLPSTGPVHPTLQPTLAPLDPLDGPALGEGADRFGLALAQASQAARANPTLTDLQTLLEDPQAMLAGAVLFPERDATETVETRLVWTLAYTAPDQGPVLVDCYRDPHVAAVGTLPPAPAPVAVCQPTTDPTFGPRWTLSQVPQRGADDLLTRAASFDLTLERWARVDPDNATAPVTSAAYRTWTPDVSGARPYVAVGSHAGGSAAEALESQGVATSMALDLETGASYAERRTLRQATAFGGNPAPLAGQGPPAAPGAGLDWDLPLLLGTAAGALGVLGLLLYLLGPGKGLLWGLYTRLTRPDVLDHPTRREVLSLVQAEPGLHTEALKRRLSSNPRTAEYHLDVLVREGFLSTVETGGYVHHFEKGAYTPEEMQALAHLHHGQAAAVFQAIRDHPGTNLSGVAEAAGVSRPYTSKLVTRLQEVGLVDKVREGRSITLYPRRDGPRPPDA